MENNKKKPIVPRRWIRPSLPPSDHLDTGRLPPHPGPAYAFYKYAEEYENADIRSYSDSIFYTCRKIETSGDGICYITHIVIRDPSQVRGLLAKGELLQSETPAEAAVRTGARILVNGSFFEKDFSRSGGSLWIMNGRILEGGYSNGYEVCLCSDGTIFFPAITRSPLF